MCPRMCHEHTGSLPGCQSAARSKWRSVDNQQSPVAPAQALERTPEGGGVGLGGVRPVER